MIKALWDAALAGDYKKIDDLIEQNQEGAKEAFHFLLIDLDARLSRSPKDEKGAAQPDKETRATHSLALYLAVFFAAELGERDLLTRIEQVGKRYGIPTRETMVGAPAYRPGRPEVGEWQSSVAKSPTDYLRQILTLEEDGTFKLAVLSRGSFGIGMASYSGKYQVMEQKIRFSEIKHSWMPQEAGQEPRFTDRPEKDLEFDFTLENNDTTLMIPSLYLYARDKTPLPFQRKSP